MKKFPLFIIILVILALFVFADFTLNKPNTANILTKNTPDASAAPTPSDSAPLLLKIGDNILNYLVKNQTVSRQIFEKIDLSNIKNINVYRNELIKTKPLEESIPAEASDKPSKPKPPQSASPIILYEIQGPVDQGSLTYLNVKLQFIAQINATVETLNETGTFGQNSFFFNDAGHADTAFLLIQIQDRLIGFQYSKENAKTYEDIKTMIEQWSPAE